MHSQCWVYFYVYDHVAIIEYWKYVYAENNQFSGSYCNEILGNSRAFGRKISRFLPQYLGIPSPKKKVYIWSTFSQKYIRSLARSCKFVKFFFTRPKRFHSRYIYLLRYSDWNLLRSDFLIVEDQSKRSILERD